mgnify:CR=1 FL=1
MKENDNVEFVRNALKENGTPAEEVSASADCALFKTTVGEYPGPFKTFDVAMAVEEDAVRSRAMFPVAVPEKRLSDIAEYVARVNQDLKFGMMLVNYDNGYLSSSFVYPMSAIRAEGYDSINMVFGVPATLLAIHASHLARVISGDATPKKEYAAYEAEAASREDGQ